MRKSLIELFFVNILVSIDKIMRNTKGLSFDEFVSDEKVFGLTVRELQEIGESARKILQSKSIVDTSSIEWRRIIDFRNFVVHRYFSIEPMVVFEVVKKELPSLEKNVLEIIKQTVDKKVFMQAISDTKKFLSKIKRHESIAYLGKIESLLKN